MSITRERNDTDLNATFDAGTAQIEELGQAALRNSDLKYRDQRVWDQLIHPDHIRQVLSSLYTMRDTNISAMAKKKTEHEDFELEYAEEMDRLGDSGSNDPDVRALRTENRRRSNEYNAWHRRASNFARSVSRAIQEIRQELRDQDSGSLTSNAAYNEARVHQLERAIRNHREAIISDDADPEYYDRNLWEELDSDPDY